MVIIPRILFNFKKYSYFLNLYKNYLLYTVISFIKFKHLNLHLLSCLFMLYCIIKTALFQLLFSCEVDMFSQNMIHRAGMGPETPSIIGGVLQIHQYEKHAKIVVLDRVNIPLLN
jgi:hypothetical protein